MFGRHHSLQLHRISVLRSLYRKFANETVESLLMKPSKVYKIQITQYALIDGVLTPR